MNLIRNIYPLWLREKLYFHTVFRGNCWPGNVESAELEFAPARMTSFLRTDVIHRQIVWTGFYEPELSRRISQLGRDGGLLVDVGANIGYFSCIWAAVNPANKVYAYEPSPKNLVMLRKNFLALPNRGNLEIFDHALGKENGTFSFDIGPDEQSGWGGLTKSPSARSLSVAVKKLDDVIGMTETVSVLKIDTEGADTWVLMGAKRLINQKRVKNIFYEVNVQRMEQLGIEPEEAGQFLTDAGYQVNLVGDTLYHAAPK